jgi:hypothetical protein
VTPSEFFKGETKHLQAHLDFVEAARLDLAPAAGGSRYVVGHEIWEGGKRTGHGTGSGPLADVLEYSVSVRDKPNRAGKPGFQYTLADFSRGGRGLKRHWFDWPTAGKDNPAGIPRTSVQRLEKPLTLKPGQAAVLWVFTAAAGPGEERESDLEVFEPVPAEKLADHLKEFKPKAPLVIVIWASVPKD